MSVFKKQKGRETESDGIPWKRCELLDLVKRYLLSKLKMCWQTWCEQLNCSLYFPCAVLTTGVVLFGGAS